MGIQAFIKGVAIVSHRLAATTRWSARAYLWGFRSIARVVSPHQRHQLLNSLASVVWPDDALVPQKVTVGGAAIRIKPHNGEFDFQAVLGGDLNYEREVFDFLDTRIAHYDAVLEIGANVGVFTAFLSARLAKTGCECKIYAFEPSARAFDRLRENLRNNQFENVHAFQCAIGDSDGISWFYEPRGHLTNGSLLQDFAANFSDDISKVPCVSLQASSLLPLLADHRRVLVKIDAEGAEARVLRSLSPVIHAKRPDVILEVLPEYASEIHEAVVSVVDDYEFFAIAPDGPQQVEKIRAIGGRDCFLSAGLSTP